MPKCAAVVAVIALVAAGCGGSTRTVSITTTAPSMTRTATTRSVTTTTTTSSLSSDEVLAIPAVGGFYGRCVRGARVWTLRFVVPAGGASDVVSSQVGNGPVRRVEVNPGGAAAFHLVPGAVRTPEPADRISRHRATTVATTPPLDVRISQASEAQYVSVAVHLALATVGGATGECVLVGSRVDARTYFSGAP
jgi:hypothetical protein